MTESVTMTVSGTAASRPSVPGAPSVAPRRGFGAAGTTDGWHLVRDGGRPTPRGLHLARATVAYEVVEGGVAITAVLAPGPVSVVGSGIDPSTTTCGR